MLTAPDILAANTIATSALRFDSEAARVAITVAVLVLLGALVAALFARIGLRAYAEAAQRERELRRQAELARADSQRFAAELQDHATQLEHQTQEARTLAAELRTAEERLRLAVTSADIGTWDSDMTNMALDLSDRCKTVFGLPADASVTYDMLLDRVHREDHGLVRSKIRAALDPLGDGELRADFRVHWPDRSVRWVDARGRAFFEGPPGARRAVRFTGTALDITPRIQAEEALRDEARLVETIQRIGSVVTAELDIDRLMQRVTDEATAFTGAEFGAFIYGVVAADGAPRTMYALAGIQQPSTSTSSREAAGGSRQLDAGTRPMAIGPDADAIIRSDDLPQDAHYSGIRPFEDLPVEHPPVRSYLGVPVISRTGRVLGRLLFAHSLPGIFAERDERVAIGIASWASVAMDNAWLYEEERRSRAEAQAANKVKSEFLTTMSHELRTPLNAIAGYAELLTLGLRGPVTPQQREDLARIQHNQRHLLSLINDILNFARLEAGHLDFELREVPVTDLLSGLGPLVEPLVRARSLEYSCRLDGAPVIVRADPDKVQQILINLLSNAIKFTQPGGRIGIDYDASPDDVMIHVRDTGRGVSADKLERMFEPFVQLDRRLTSSHEGTGLGLAISRDLARGMGGELSASSTLGAGSCFTLTLPRAGR
jgi:signal transduction histidine kinase/PAS domain-containing protein